MESPAEDYGVADGIDVRRLHPWTLLQRFVISLPGFVILLIPVLRSPSGSNWLNLGIAAIYGAVTLPLIYLQYHRFRYWITSSELVIHSGVLTRRRRNIPIERIQNIDVERKLLPRILGTASVKVFTAGSATAEGVLEYVSVGEASRVREVIRTFQRQQRDAVGAEPAGGPAPAVDVSSAVPPVHAVSSAEILDSSDHFGRADTEKSQSTLVSMKLDRVLLSGMFRFSLLYIAIIFSFLQFIEPDPDQLAEMLTRGQLRMLTEVVSQSPWIAGAVAVVAAAVLSWVSGIAVNLNKYYGFRLWKESDKLHKRHGLLTISETTIPLKKIQALICRSNPVMSWFGWWSLELQTMGLNVREQGFQVAAPFSQEREIGTLADHVLPVEWPNRMSRVSARTIRRMSVRYGAVLIVVSAAVSVVWSPALYTLVLLPLAPLWAWLHYRGHGYTLTTHGLVIRKGVIRRMLWYIPTAKMHVFYSTQSIFQRRLGLKTVYVDTAGASALHFPTIVDIPAGTADALTDNLYANFRETLRSRSKRLTRDHEDSTGPDRERPVSSFALPVPGDQ